MKMFKSILFWTSMILFGLTTIGLAAEYPTRQITVILPTAPGGSAMISGQILMEALKKQLNHVLVINYKPGALQAVGTEAVLNARPDGYTLGYTYEPDLASKILLDGKKLSWGKDDFTHIGITAFSPFLLWVKNDAPWKTFEELISYGRSNVLSYGSAGIGAMNHVFIELLAQKTGIKVNHVPYSGSGEVTTALLGGHINMTLGVLGRMKQYYDSGAVRPLVALSDERLLEAKDVPTGKEKGFPIRGYNYHHLWGPKALPADITSRLMKAFEGAVKDPEFRTTLIKAGFEPRLVLGKEAKELWEADFKVVGEVLSQWTTK
jgi:tripartite-type tricarboxylate transporter receptor subunit TctC